MIKVESNMKIHIINIAIICIVICSCQSSHKGRTTIRTSVSSLNNSISNDTTFIISILRSAETDVHIMSSEDISKRFSKSLKSHGYKYDGKKCNEDFDERMYGTYVYCKNCHVNRKDSIDYMDTGGSMIGFLSYGFGPAVIYETADKKLCGAILNEILKDDFKVEETGKGVSWYIREGEKEFTWLQYLVEDGRKPNLYSLLISRRAK